MQMVRFTCRVFAQLNLYQLYDVFRYLCIDETDFHVQSLDSGTTEGVGEASDTEVAPKDEEG